MQDLNVIIQKNAEVVEAYAKKEQAAGKFVVVKYTGVNFHDYEAFDNERDRNEAASAWTAAGAGHRTELLNPTNT